MDAELNTRYDRQIRLWGKSTQQRLMQTRVHIYGIEGVSSEVAKNLVLAGVHSVCVMDNEPITEKDLEHNFLLQNGNALLTRGEAAVQSLQSMNPYVKMACTQGSEELTADGSEPIRVAVAQVKSLDDITTLVPTLRGSDLISLIVACESEAVAIFLYNRLGLSLEVQVREMLQDPMTLGKRPALFQRAALLLHLRSPLLERVPCTTEDYLLAAAGIIQQLHLNELRASDVARVVRLVGCGSRTTAIAATTAGAAIAQHIIRHAGAGEGGEYRWMACEAGESAVCQVGVV